MVDGKVEFFNPGESIKDRMALRMIEAAERSKKLVPSQSVLVEISSGNTGVALAWIAIIKVYAECYSPYFTGTRY